MYTIQVKNAAGTTLGQFETFTKLKIGKRLNNYGSASFSVPISENKLDTLVSLRQNTIWVYRDGALVWAGEMALRSGMLDNKGSGIVSIHCFDWLEQWRHRFTADEVEYVATDAGQIAWELIDTSQTQSDGDFGIVEGTIEVTIDRDRTYYNQNIMEAIVNLSNVISGFDFEITNQKVFNVQQTIGEDLTDTIVLEYGHNILSCQITEDYTFPINRAIVLGEATGEVTLQRVERDNEPSQDLIKLREDTLAEMDVSEIETLEEKGDSLLRKHSFPLLKISTELLPNSPNISQFSLGDLIRLKIVKGFYNIDEEYRIFEWEVEVDENDVENLSLVLGKFTI